MIKIFKRTAALSLPLAAILFGLTMPVFSQAPTNAQRSAIRSECRSDYEAHCASIPPGGAASRQCLQKNISSLSPACQTAVRAVEAPAAPKAESSPAAPKAESTPSAAKPAAETTPPPAAKAAASTTAKKPAGAQAAAIRSACRSDYQKVCAGVPTGGSAALQCLEQNKSKVSAPCQQAVGAATAAAGAATAAPATAPPAGAPAAAPAPGLALRPLRPREEIFVLRSACGGDVRSLCGGVQPGGGRIVQCLAAKAASISPACKEVLSQFAAR
jgi:cysteine rich repeat protein